MLLNFGKFAHLSSNTFFTSGCKQILCAITSILCVEIMFILMYIDKVMNLDY